MMTEPGARERAVATLSAEERERGERLMLRSDALNHAYVALEAQEWTLKERKALILAAIDEMRQEAKAAWERFTEEHSIPEA